MQTIARGAALLTALMVLVWCTTARAQCRPGDLLLDKAPTHSRGVEGVELITDGLLTLEGEPPNEARSATMRGLRPMVEWDLGSVVHLVALAVQADNNDSYRVSVSLDGKSYRPLWELPRIDDSGLRERAKKDLDIRARYLRLEALSGDQVYAVSEVRAFCQTPDPWPPLRVVRTTVEPHPIDTLIGQIQSFKVILGIVGLFLLLRVLPRSIRDRRNKRICAALIAVSALGWTHFGLFHGNAIPHYWDAFHYFMGSKYFPELGYFELYRCGAKAERELGHGDELDRMTFRDLDDNRVYPGVYTRTPEGQCRAVFSSDRWNEFKADLESHRPLFRADPLGRAFNDHGYNATPITVAWLRLWTSNVSASVNALNWLVVLDLVALALALAVTYWGFGPWGCAVVALVLGIGFPWSYSWVGGGIGRHTWFFCACSGFALLRRRHVFWGLFVLSIAGLLRLFPFVFVGAAGLWVLVRWIRAKRLDATGRRGLAAVALALAIGIPIGAFANGWSSYPAFYKVMRRHASTPLANQMGLPSMLGFRADLRSTLLEKPRLTDPMEVWRAEVMLNRKRQLPLWGFGILVSLGLVAWAAYRGATIWETAALGGPLLFSLLPMTSYDYIWLALLVALADRRRARGGALVAFALLTQVLYLFLPDTEVRHFLYSLGCLGLLGWLSYDMVRELAPQTNALAPK